MTNQENQNKVKNPYYSQNELVQQSPSPLNNQGLYPPLEGNNYPPARQNNNVPNISNGMQQHNQYISPHSQQNQANNSQQYHQQPQPIYIINQNGPMLGHCQFCGIQTQTFVTRVNGGFVWLMCFIFFLFVCWLCCIPFFVDQWKDKQYRCRKCGQIKNVVAGGC